MTQKCASIILAAGKGTRMKSATAKVLHPIAGLPMVCHVLHTISALNPVKNIVVASPENQSDLGQAFVDFNTPADIALQTSQQGTAHATDSARESLSDFKDGTVFVLFGDTPFVSVATLQKMIHARAKSSIVVLGFETEHNTGYGRLIMDGDTLDRIVEEKDASDTERKVTLCNSGVMAIDAQHLFNWIDGINNNNAQGEYYLTDLPAIAKVNGMQTSVVVATQDELQGINSRGQLADAERWYQNQRRSLAMADGVTLTAPETVYFSYDTKIENDVVIEPHVVFGTGVSVATGATIRAFSHLEGTTVGRDAMIGPYARLRPGTHVGDGGKIGNFVETKNTTLGVGAKVNHLSYVGDATVGDKTNIGAGTITCNYDGYLKHKTTIGNNVFVGSNTSLVAPVTLSDGALIGAGSVVTSNVETDDMHVVRGEAKTITAGAKRFRTAKEKIKNAQKNK